jgi:hypothetical protein
MRDYAPPTRHHLGLTDVKKYASMDAMSEKKAANLSNAAALIDGLDSTAIARQLEELEGQKSALRVLLRAARARERGRRQNGSAQRSDVKK